MRLCILSRALVASWGLWFTAALSEVPGLHACPVHDGNAVHSIANGHAAHAGHMVHESESHAPVDPLHHPAGCTCLGLCCGATPAVAPSAPVELTADVAVAAPIVGDTVVARPTIQRAHSLPFANGPPAL